MNTVNVIVCHGNLVTSCFSFGSSGDEMLKAEEQFRTSAAEFGAHEKSIQQALDTDRGEAFICQGKWSINLVSNSNKEDEGWQEDDECPNCHCGTLGLENGHLVCRGECGQFIEKNFQETMNGLIKRCQLCGNQLLDNGECPSTSIL